MLFVSWHSCHGFFAWLTWGIIKSRAINSKVSFMAATKATLKWTSLWYTFDITQANNLKTLFYFDYMDYDVPFDSEKWSTINLAIHVWLRILPCDEKKSNIFFTGKVLCKSSRQKSNSPIDEQIIQNRLIWKTMSILIYRYIMQDRFLFLHSFKVVDFKTDRIIWFNYIILSYHYIRLYAIKMLSLLQYW